MLLRHGCHFGMGVVNHPSTSVHKTGLRVPFVTFFGNDKLRLCGPGMLLPVQRHCGEAQLHAVQGCV